VLLDRRFRGAASYGGNLAFSYYLAGWTGDTFWAQWGAAQGGCRALHSGGGSFDAHRGGARACSEAGNGRTYTARVDAIRETGDTPLESDILVLSLGPMAIHRLSLVQTGAVLRIATTSVPKLTGIRTAIGGGPILVQNGKRQKLAGQAGEAYEISSRFERHPRTAVGWNERHLFLVEVDGRQRDLSVGMTLDELTQFLLKLGCQEAVNLDGGGSAALWFEGKIRNNPCDGYERAIANALVIVKKAGKTGALPAAKSN
jgi:hypothetical protein